ncbi:transcription factor FapR [Alicyclobacillus sp.]|uniref:transcription factor FapR n=1 Tax=Alicyclobacillus sp. TaxID=61169 RepID=UPI0025B9163E|nr:transcription factor FapR [Alicyclobacillus sp.]MCL6516442.1 transcription factor FapR [Alicyclobacillus sp.]
MKKSERRAALVQKLREDPFVTDEQLADYFQVSVATIRLDRAALNIPEVRERMRRMAHRELDALRSLDHREVVGEIQELVLGRFATSVLRVSSEHVFARTGIMRGHHLFAQVNSLATAVVDADVVVTAKAEVRFHRPVRLGEWLHSRVDVLAQRAGITKCQAVSRVGGERVLEGVIWAKAVRDDARWPWHEGVDL